MTTKDLAKAIIDMAEKDKGLVLSKLEELIEQYAPEVRLAYGQGYDDGFDDAADAVATGALVETPKADLTFKSITEIRDMARASVTPEQRQEAANLTGQILAERAAYVRAQEDINGKA